VLVTAQLLTFAASALTRSAHAESAEVGRAASPTPARVLVMREGDGPRSEFAQRVERALHRSLSELSFTVGQSALPFHDAQLAAGCSGGVRECGSQVAAGLDSEELVVSTIEDAPHLRHATLRLLRFAPHGPPRAGAAQLPREPDQELSLTVFALVESLFADRARTPAVRAASAAPPTALAEPSASAVPPHASPLAQSTASEDYVASVARAQQRRRLLAIGWPAVSIGAGLLVGGLVANLSAQRESEAYESVAPSSRGQVDAKLAHYRAAEDKAQTARILWGVGGGLAAAGVFVLLWERFAPASDRKLQKSAVRKRGAGVTAGLSASASPHGLALAWSTDL
jgi:hypothetical protein